MKAIFTTLLLLSLPPLVAGVVMTAPRWLRGTTTNPDHPPDWKDRRERTRRLEGNPAHRQNADENDPNKTFEAAGVIDLDFNPSFVVYDLFDHGPGLTVSSYHNVALNPVLLLGGTNLTAAPGTPPYIPFERDLVALISDLDSEEPAVECLTENTTMDTVWPNEARRAPDGMFPFEAVVIPQGWFAKHTPGCLVAFGVDTEDEVLIHASTREEPRFYHSVQFVDMDQDGVLDVVTVRSGYQARGYFHPPCGELVWFRNPGLEAITKGKYWEEFIIVDNLGADVYLDAKDLTGDGVPEIVAANVFSGTPSKNSAPWGSTSQVFLYGAPEGKTWASLNTLSKVSAKPRVANLVDDQGLMFSVQIVDLDGDGNLDILATNHQCANDPIDGRVLGLESPKSGNLFEDRWKVHVLKDGIRPTSCPPGVPSFRMAPGVAKSFESPQLEVTAPADNSSERPWIAVSGDQASQAWVLKPTSEPWVYTEELLFDINEYYGEGTTQTILQDPFGITISTVGEIGIREEKGQVTLYAPVFEATDIHVFQSKSIGVIVESESRDAQGPKVGEGRSSGGQGRVASSTSVLDSAVTAKTHVPTWVSWGAVLGTTMVLLCV